jgi:enoyl-CoA hydratase
MEETPADEFIRVRYELPRPDVARIVLCRPEAANAQDYRLLWELTKAFDIAAADSSVRVVILAAEGRHFSSGHDTSGPPSADDELLPVFGTASDFAAPGAAGYLNWEREAYLGFCRRWRDSPKVTIAQVQGKVIAGGLMLIWPMDLVVCSEEATFTDPVVALGYNGVEYFAHVHELGVRRAKDLLFTGRPMTAAEALQIGMVQRVVSRDGLEAAALDLAAQIAQRPAFALEMAKRAANFAQDSMGLQQTLDGTFAMHHIMHSHWNRLYGEHTPPGAIDALREVLKQRPLAHGGYLVDGDGTA